VTPYLLSNIVNLPKIFKIFKYLYYVGWSVLNDEQEKKIVLK
jgi:hypothetical protein